MAVFPISPSANDTTTIGGTTYIYTGVAWRVVTGNVAITTFAATPHSNPDLGDFWYNTTSNILYMRVEDGASTDLWLDISTAGGAGLWSGAPEDASLDGVVAVKKQTAAPSATADYAKVYSKSVTSNINAEVLFHFNGDVTDSSGNGNDGTNTGVIFANSGVTGFGSGQAGVFDGAAATSGGDDFVAFDDPGIGTGDFTLEFWWRRDLKTVVSSGYKDCPVTVDTGASSAMALGGFALYFFSTTSARLVWWDHVSNARSSDDDWTVPAHSADEWHHVRFVRSGQDHILFWDGAKVGSTYTHTAYSVGSGSLTWYLGRLWDGTAFPEYNLEGQMEEFTIVKSALSTTSFVPPSAPYVPTTATKLFAMDSAGNETQITP